MVLCQTWRTGYILQLLKMVFYFKPQDVVDDDGEMVKEGVKVDGIRLEGLKLSYVLFQSSGVIRDFQIVKCQLSGS